MRPELINRFDKIVVFRALTKKEVTKILDIQLAELATRLQRKGIGLSVTTKAKKILIDKGYDAKRGVRPLRRVIQDELEHPIAEGLLSNSFETGHIVNVGAQKGVLTIQATSESDAEHE